MAFQPWQPFVLQSPIDLTRLEATQLVTWPSRSLATDVLGNYASNALLQTQTAYAPLPLAIRSHAIVDVAIRCRLNVAYA